MVVKTQVCSWSELKIYPGHGKTFISKEGKQYKLLSKKVFKLLCRKVKAQCVRWTPTWRRNHKKDAVQGNARRRTRKTARFQKSIVGMTMQDIVQRKCKIPELRKENAERIAAAKEKKEKMKKTMSNQPTGGKQQKVTQKGPAMKVQQAKGRR